MATQQYNSLVLNVPAIPPLIPESTSFDTNFTDKLQVQIIRTTELTDGTAVLSGGRLTGLLDPVDLQDAANKSFADANITSYIPGNPFNSIQFSSEGSTVGTYIFTGSSDLTYNSVTNTMYAKNIRIGNTSSGLLIGSNTIDNLDDPVNDQDPATKNFVDNFFLFDIVNVSNNVPTTYTASDMVGHILNRSGFSSNITDTTANAADIINEISGSLGTSVFFYLKNMSPNYSINLLAGTSVTMEPTSVLIYPGYQMSSVLIVDSVSTVKLYVSSLNYMYSSDNFIIGDRSLNITSDITRITDQFIFNTESNILSGVQNATYTAADISGIIYRSYTGAKIDHFDNVSTFISQILPVTGPIDYIFSNGGVEVVIKNISSSGSIVIESNGWILDTDSNMTIGPGQTGTFYLVISSGIGYIYTLGIFS